VCVLVRVCSKLLASRECVCVSVRLCSTQSRLSVYVCAGAGGRGTIEFYLFHYDRSFACALSLVLSLAVQSPECEASALCTLLHTRTDKRTQAQNRHPEFRLELEVHCCAARTHAHTHTQSESVVFLSVSVAFDVACELWPCPALWRAESSACH